MNRKILAAILLCTFAFSAFADVLVDAVNQNRYPVQSEWYAAEVGWQYTPTISYTLTGMFTKFGYVDNRTVTLEIYDGLPSNGGTLLRSAGFIPASLIYSGASFAPINLVAGHTYFIGFRNVSGLDVNVTYNPDLTDYFLYYSYADYDDYSIITPSDSPILEFYGQVSPPEAVDQLISIVKTTNIQNIKKTWLTSILFQAKGAFSRNNTVLGTKLLKTFQNQVRLQIARTDSTDAKWLIATAQEIIDTVVKQPNHHSSRQS